MNTCTADDIKIVSAQTHKTLLSNRKYSAEYSVIYSKRKAEEVFNMNRKQSVTHDNRKLLMYVGNFANLI